MAARWGSERSFLTGWLNPALETARQVSAAFPQADADAFLNGGDDRRVRDVHRLNLTLAARGAVEVRGVPEADEAVQYVLTAYHKEERR